MVVFFLYGTATTEIYTLSLHDALPISFACGEYRFPFAGRAIADSGPCRRSAGALDRSPDSREFSDRKSTRLNSSHVEISYAVFCLKKTTHQTHPPQPNNVPPPPHTSLT